MGINDAHLDLVLQLKVILEPLQVEDDSAGQTLDTHPLQRVHLLIALPAHIGIIALQHLASNEGVERLCDGLLVLHFQGDEVERIVSVARVGAALSKDRNEYVSR